MVSEGKTRERKKEILGGAIHTRMLPFLFKEGEETSTKLAPISCIPQLTQHIMATLDELDRLDLLTWDYVPIGKIYIKIGGDHGGGSTKFFYEIVNVSKPNSSTNTTVFCVYEADESLSNMHIALDPFVEEINALPEASWRGMPIDVWICGDYEIERKLLGLQGASATYPCTMCHVKKEELSSSEDFEARTLTTIEDDYNEVERQNHSSESKRTNHSVSSKPFFQIPVAKVCPPGLHISLGLWHKFYKNLERDLERLGKLIAEDKARREQAQDDQSGGFSKYVRETRHILEELEEIKEKGDKLRDEATDLEYDLMTQSLTASHQPSQDQMNTIEKLHQEANKLDKQADDLRAAHKLEDKLNPLIDRLDATLQSFKVRRQAFYSKSFVGNHVNKCLKPENYTVLLDSIVEATSDMCPGSDELHDMTVSLKMKHMLLFERFAKVHNVYNRACTLTEQEIEDLEKNIHLLVSYYTKKFPYPRYTFTPKFHILYKHVIPFIQSTGVALGVLAEQGGEQLHKLFNALKRRLQGSRNVKDSSPDQTLLHCIMEEHLISVHPSNRQFSNEV